jgi:hypothetical protein
MVHFRMTSKGTFDGVYFFQLVHCALEDLSRPDFYNGYHHYHSRCPLSGL